VLEKNSRQSVARDTRVSGLRLKEANLRLSSGWQKYTVGLGENLVLVSATQQVSHPRPQPAASTSYVFSLSRPIAAGFRTHLRRTT